MQCSPTVISWTNRTEKTNIDLADAGSVFVQDGNTVSFLTASPPERTWRQQPVLHPEGGSFMAVSKSRRFEIFKRDGFTCQYCGQRPPEVVLEVDHIEPRAHGGDDEELNLITSCWDCNRGKRDKRLDDIHPRPDADVAFLEAQQEIAEARRYLATKEARESVQADVMAALDEEVKAAFSFVRSFWNSDVLWRSLLQQYSPEEIESAIWIVGGRYRDGTFSNKPMDAVHRYLRAVLRNNHESQQ